MARRTGSLLRWALPLAATMLAAAAHADGAAPADTKGTTVKALGSIDLSAEVEGLSGRQLRARLVTIEPGGTLAVHSHKDRPTLEYVVQGNATEVRNGVEIPHAPGDMVVATHDVTHGWENKGTVPVVLLPVDIVRP